MARTPASSASAISRRTTWWCAPGPSPRPSPSTAGSTSSATSTSGRARSSARIRRSGCPAAARSRPGGGAPRWTTSTATCRITATRPGGRRWTGSGTKCPAWARTAIPTSAGFLQFVGVGESRQHAFDLYAEAAEYFYGRCLHVDPRWADAARLHQRGQPARRHRKPDQDGRRCQCARQVHRRTFRLRRTRDGCDRRQRLRHHRHPRRGRRAASRSRRHT